MGEELRITKFVRIKIWEEEKGKASKVNRKKTFDKADTLLIFFLKTLFFFFFKARSFRNYINIIGILHPNINHNVTPNFGKILHFSSLFSFAVKRMECSSRVPKRNREKFRKQDFISIFSYFIFNFSITSLISIFDKSESTYFILKKEKPFSPRHAVGKMWRENLLSSLTFFLFVILKDVSLLLLKKRIQW